ISLLNVSHEPLEYNVRLRVTAVATPNLRIHTQRVEAGNGRRNKGTYPSLDHCQPSMIRETECPA
ncbi:hypothetical protein, partial [Limnospira platensis]|uniref:hypothetical protein n=1 Tax=Limnospira platensis TaxID=118562 RepID=UPI003395DCF4